MITRGGGGRRWPPVAGARRYARAAMTSRRRIGLVVAGVALALVVVILVASSLASPRSQPAPTTTSPTVPTTTNPLTPAEERAIATAEGSVNASLPSAEGAPAPRLRLPPYRRPLGRHEVVGFVPYYELGAVQGEDFADFTYLVYSALSLRRNGSLVETADSGGWASLEDGGAGGLVAAGHAAGDRVLLSVFAQSQSILGPLTTSPRSSANRLADQLAPLLSHLGFDGVDLDLEGEDASDRAGFVTFVSALSSRLRRIEPSWTIMLNTFPQSVEDPTGFFDVPALAGAVDRIFVMAYDMGDDEIPSANAPLMGATLDDADALASYTAAGLAGKTILGVPFYGYDYPAAAPLLGAAAIGNPYSVTYDEIVASIRLHGHRPRWDPTTDTPYTVFKRGGGWHQTWFDDPTSIALKTALAAAFHIVGVGAWELGMVQGQPEMIRVLEGGSPVVKLPLAAQPRARRSR
jgi:Glycosyl hydrolases family 18